MNPHDDRTTRWLAHLLGELDSEEARRVECEMRDNPEEADKVTELLQTATDWAKQPVDHTPVDMAELLGHARAADDLPKRRAPFRTLWPWALAASLLILAITQAAFTLEVGDTALHWGRSNEALQINTLEKEIADLSEAYTATRGENAEFEMLLDALAEQTLELEVNLQYATSSLAQRQREESRIRYNDMQHLLEITSSANYARSIPESEIVQAEY